MTGCASIGRKTAPVTPGLLASSPSNVEDIKLPWETSKLGPAPLAVDWGRRPGSESSDVVPVEVSTISVRTCDKVRSRIPLGFVPEICWPWLPEVNGDKESIRQARLVEFEPGLRCSSSVLLGECTTPTDS